MARAITFFKGKLMFFSGREGENMEAQAKPLVAQVREKGLLRFVEERFPVVRRVLFRQKEKEATRIQTTMKASLGSISIEAS